MSTSIHPSLEELVEFEWFPGFALAHKQKCVQSLHAATIESLGVTDPLEISSKSPESAGRALSAFSLEVLAKSGPIPLESAFQGSKVFEDGGPFIDLYERKPREAKKDERIRSSGELVGFEFVGSPWPREPTTSFYDWLYMRALATADRDLVAKAVVRDAFTDIEFNPKRSLNCQARSMAMYITLLRQDGLGVIEDPEAFRDLYLPQGRLL